jgi:ribosomal RNA-processing protein 7
MYRLFHFYIIILLTNLLIFTGWLQDYRLHRPDQIKLQEEVDEYMRKFEEAELERHKVLEAKLNQPDEDGFITVTRVGRRSANTDGKITVTAAKPEEIKNLKPKNKELTDFYRFQMREAKRNSKYKIYFL